MSALPNLLHDPVDYAEFPISIVRHVPAPCAVQYTTSGVENLLKKAEERGYFDTRANRAKILAR